MEYVIGPLIDMMLKLYVLIPAVIIGILAPKILWLIIGCILYGIGFFLWILSQVKSFDFEVAFFFTTIVLLDALIVYGVRRFIQKGRRP